VFKIPTNNPSPQIGPNILWLLIPLAVGCTEVQVSDPLADNRLEIAIDSAPINLDPRIGSDQSSSRVFNLILNGLVTKDPHGNIVPDLAESWEVLDDGRRYRFHLRSGVRFHNGKDLRSEDVAWTFQSILDNTVISPKKGALEQVDRVDVVDPLTVDFVMTEPFGAILVSLTSFLGIVPAGVGSDEFNASPIGTGPFRLVERNSDRLVFEAYEGYRDGRPHLDRIVLREVPDSTVRALELKKGSIQLIVGSLAPDLVAGFREDPAFKVVADPGANYAYLGFNLEDPVLGNKKVRRALAHAIDRQRIVDTLWQGLGTVTETILPPGHWARNETLAPIETSIEKARDLLDEAGYPVPVGTGSRTRFAITYKTSTDETAVLQAQIIQAMLAEIDVSVTIRSNEFATFYSDIKQGNFQMFSLVWSGVVDPDILSLVLHSKKIPPLGANRGRYLNLEFDRLVEAGARPMDIDLRRPFYLKAQEIFAEELPYISLFHKTNVAVMHAQLQGYENYPNGEFLGLRNVRWAPSDP